MNGIIAIRRYDGGTPERSELSGMAAAMRPDSTNLSGWGFSHTDSSAALGGNPARIVPEDKFERQPLTESSVVLVADARLDNRRELSSHLRLNSAEAGILPDSALILRAYLRWGQDCTDYLLGDFAFAIWDARIQTLLCCRDHRGNRPLFYYSSPHFLAVASAPRALLTLPGVPRRLKHNAVADFLVLIGNEAETFYEGILRVPPGCWLKAGPTRIAVHPYWQFDPARRIVFRRDEEYLEAFHELLGEAVRCRLRTSTPVGAFMSGGLDSSTVACLAAEEMAKTGGRLFTFTAGPARMFHAQESACHVEDETKYVSGIHAMYPNMIPVFERAERRNSLSETDELFAYLESPIMNPSNRVWMEAIISGAADRGIRVLLTGQEGNQWISFSGHPALREYAARGNWLKLLREVRALAKERGRSVKSILRSFVIPPSVRQPLRIVDERPRSGPDPWAAYSAIHPDFAHECGVKARLAALAHAESRHPYNGGREIRAVAANAGVVHYGLDCLTAWRSRFGVELRDPTADMRVAEFCLAIPNDQHLRAGQERSLVRRAMAGKLPPSVLLNRKRGKQAADWFMRLSAARDEIRDELNLLERCELARCCLDLPRMRRLLDHWPVADARSPQITRDYLGVLDRGLGVGRFLRWFGSN